MKKRFKKVYVEITNICNLNCEFCPKTNRTQKNMTIDEFMHIVKSISPFTDYIYFHIMGEPLLHPNLSDFLQICKNNSISVNITTNGTFISKVEQQLLKSGALRKISFSLHSLEANSKEETLLSYLENIFSFTKLAAASGIICEFRLWNENSEKRLGKNEQNEKILKYLEESFQISLDNQNKENIKILDNIFLSHANIFTWPDIKRELQSDLGYCLGLRDQIGILVDGTVVPCCLDSQGSIKLGNVFETPISKIIQNERVKSIYNGFSNRKAVELLCKTCGYRKRFDKD